VGTQEKMRWGIYRNQKTGTGCRIHKVVENGRNGRKILALHNILPSKQCKGMGTNKTRGGKLDYRVWGSRKFGHPHSCFPVPTWVLVKERTWGKTLKPEISPSPTLLKISRLQCRGRGNFWL